MPDRGHPETIFLSLYKSYNFSVLYLKERMLFDEPNLQMLHFGMPHKKRRCQNIISLKEISLTTPDKKYLKRNVLSSTKFIKIENFPLDYLKYFTS